MYHYTIIFYDASHSNGYYDMRELFNNTLVQRYDKYAVTFVDNHDTQPGQSLTSFIEDWFNHRLMPASY